MEQIERRFDHVHRERRAGAFAEAHLEIQNRPRRSVRAPRDGRLRRSDDRKTDARRVRDEIFFAAAAAAVAMNPSTTTGTLAPRRRDIRPPSRRSRNRRPPRAFRCLAASASRCSVERALDDFDLAAHARVVEAGAAPDHRAGGIPVAAEMTAAAEVLFAIPISPMPIKRHADAGELARDFDSNFDRARASPRASSRGRSESSACRRRCDDKSRPRTAPRWCRSRRPCRRP